MRHVGKCCASGEVMLCVRCVGNGDVGRSSILGSACLSQRRGVVYTEWRDGAGHGMG